ncbi:hypothetical protein [Rubellimicrobium aerolatum]|uniref:Cellulase family glycosylhydrolase n=1 Tax=Rubellimicrobium aerolatum TaxID=490979 RepID=A0ABW0SGI0_9RHOB|nr:hypothetical protein [Rubellimicrobium aerolatum]MBP1807261.1 mannan endo-1,4-beta-mannosidase [Rubellimicrobium aerolatum]
MDRHFDWLADHGVTCLRLMMEYAHGENRYLERPVGRLQPNMVRLWDDIFALCARHRLRLLLTPFDTFWLWLRWAKHPYNRINGGPCPQRRQLLTHRPTIEAIKARLTFIVERWGGSGVVFAWDLWNEMHPAHMGDSAAGFAGIATELSEHVRGIELAAHGRSHPQTISLFGPILRTHPEVADTIFRHPRLDFATTHLYAEGTIDAPRDTVAPAVVVGDLVREALEHCPPSRPYLDSEHGPIHTFKDRRRTLPAPFDDEYFRHIQWAHLASGGVGGGMRWPNRHPHTLTPGMRQAQAALAGFLPLIDWTRFRRRNVSREVRVSDPGLSAFACSDPRQAVVWLLRNDSLDGKGMLRPRDPVQASRVELPGVADGPWEVVAWDTRSGLRSWDRTVVVREGVLGLDGIEVPADLALALRARA